MRMIGSLDSAKHAERFAAYLLTEGINSQVEEEDGAWEVWVKDEDELKRSKNLLEEFSQSPDDKKYVERAAKADAILREKERKAREYKKKVHVGGPAVGRAQTQSTPLTICLIVLCGIVAVMTNFGKNMASPVMRSLAYNSVQPEKAFELIRKYSDNPQAPSHETLAKKELRHTSVMAGQVWRLVTPAFIHHGTMHLVFNMIWLFQLGRLIENRYGTLYLGLLSLVIAVISTFAQCAVPEAIGGSLSYFRADGFLINGLGGMSGVVFGLFGFVWVKSSIDRDSRMFIAQSTVAIMLIYLVFCMTPMAKEVGLGNIANWGHGVGLLVGCVAGYVLTRPYASGAKR